MIELFSVISSEISFQQGSQFLNLFQNFYLIGDLIVIQNILLQRADIQAWIDGEKPAQMPPDLEKTWDSIVNTILESASSFSGLEYMQRQSSSMQTKPEIEMLSQIRKSVVKYGLSKSAKQQIVLPMGCISFMGFPLLSSLD